MYFLRSETANVKKEKAPGAECSIDEQKKKDE
jgi:hypothetical protein